MGGVVATAGQFTKWYFGAYSMYPAGLDLGRGAGDSGAGLRVRTRLPLGPQARHSFPGPPQTWGRQDRAQSQFGKPRLGAGK